MAEQKQKLETASAASPADDNNRNDCGMKMIHDLEIGDVVGYRLHNSTNIITSSPSKVVKKSQKSIELDDGLTLKRRKGFWVLPMEDQHGRYHTTFYKIHPEMRLEKDVA